MTTTIAVSDLTRRRLGILKERALKEGMKKSFDQIIREVLADVVKTPHAMPYSMAGAFPELRWNKETDRMKFRGE